MPGIRSQVSAIEDWLIATRRDIHAHPELGYQETRTAGLVAGTLGHLGLEIEAGIGRTGVIGLWRGSKPGPVLGLRADMDALPVTEPEGRDFRSTTPGVMHACGHDCHVAMLLGVARVLAENPQFKETLAGAVKFIFQPAEEGGGGAAAMIADGALQDPPMEAIFATHVMPLAPVGKLIHARSVAMASVDNFHITITGRGGHAAFPEQAADPIGPAAELVGRIKNRTQSLDKTLAAVCTFNAGTQTNIIPERAVLSGTIRSLNPVTRDQSWEAIRLAAQEIEKETGRSVGVHIEASYPMLVNDGPMTDFLVGVARGIVGAENVIEQGPTYGSEDMAYFLQKIPGVHYWLGCGRTDSRPPAMLHSAEFDPDEKVLPLGVEIMLGLVETFLGRTDPLR